MQWRSSAERVASKPLRSRTRREHRRTARVRLSWLAARTDWRILAALDAKALEAEGKRGGRYEGKMVHVAQHDAVAVEQDDASKARQRERGELDEGRLVEVWGRTMRTGKDEF